MDTVEFEKIVDEAIGALPEEFKRALDNVSVTVEQWPKSKIARGIFLLGLYHGVPKTIWGRWQGLLVPDKITIYKGPIEYLGRSDRDKIRQLIIETVKHEIAHHFGISDRRLREIEMRAKR